MMKEVVGLLAQEESITMTVSRLPDGQVRMVVKGAVNRALKKDAGDKAKALHAVLERPIVVVASEEELCAQSLDDFLSRLGALRSEVRGALGNALEGATDAANAAMNMTEESKAASGGAGEAPGSGSAADAKTPSPDGGEQAAAGDAKAKTGLFEGMS